MSDGAWPGPYPWMRTADRAKTTAAKISWTVASVWKVAVRKGAEELAYLENSNAEGDDHDGGLRHEYNAMKLG